MPDNDEIKIEDLDFSDMDFGALADDDEDNDDRDFIDDDDLFDQFEAAGLADSIGPQRRAISEVDIGGYDVIELTRMHNNDDTFMFAMLTGVQSGYEKKGRGDFSCVLKWYHNSVNDADVQRYTATIRARVSRLRQRLPATERDFIVCVTHYEILSDLRHVLITMSRMRRDVYEEFAKQRAQNNNTPAQRRTAALLKLL